MNPLVFKLLKHLVPRSRVWALERARGPASKRNQLNQFFEGLSDMPGDAKSFADDLIDDLFPPTTAQLDEWEDQFGLTDVGLTDAQRRTRLAATWAALGGQSPRYIQDVLTDNGFTGVFIHEWWELPVVGAPVARDPRLYLTDGGPQLTVLLDETLAELGEPTAVLGETNDPLGYPLVNKIRTSITTFVGLDDPQMELSNFPAASAPENFAFLGQPLSVTEGTVSFPIPDDPDTWSYFLYFAGQTFPNQGTVPAARRDEFEDLLLTICPGQQWIGVLVDYI